MLGESMACPNCGGSSRTLVAPGFFRCDSDKFSPYADGQGRIVGDYTRCRQEYHETSHETLRTICRCGTFAVRQCARCSCSLCGDHGVLDEILDAWVCSACSSALHAKRIQDRVKKYLQLPEASEEELIDHFMGIGTPLRDGATHQIWRYRNGDIRRLLLLAEERWGLPPLPSGRMPLNLASNDYFEPDGSRTRDSFTSGYGGRYNADDVAVYQGTSQVAPPSARFNQLRSEKYGRWPQAGDKYALDGEQPAH